MVAIMIASPAKIADDHGLGYGVRFDWEPIKRTVWGAMEKRMSYHEEHWKLFRGFGILH